MESSKDKQYVMSVQEKLKQRQQQLKEEKIAKQMEEESKQLKEKMEQLKVSQEKNNRIDELQTSQQKSTDDQINDLIVIFKEKINQECQLKKLDQQKFALEIEQIKQHNALSEKILEQKNLDFDQQFQKMKAEMEVVITQYEVKMKHYEELIDKENQNVQEMQETLEDYNGGQKKSQSYKLMKQLERNNQDILKLEENFIQTKDNYEKQHSSYDEILSGKDQIIKQLLVAMKLKDSELAKVNEIMVEFKQAFMQYNEEKQKILEENQNLQNELSEMKSDLRQLMGLMQQEEADEVEDNSQNNDAQEKDE